MRLTVRLPLAPGLLAASAFAGLLLFLAFPHPSFWPLAFVGLVPAVLAARDVSVRQAFGVGWVMGIVHQGGLLYWIVGVLTYYGGLPLYVALPVFLLMVFYLALYPGLFLMGLKLAENHLKVKHGGWWWILAGGALFTGLEHARGFLLTGFPWEPLGAALIPAPPLIQAADLFGAGGLTFIVVLVNLALAGAWFRRLEKGRPGPWMPLALALGLAAALFGYGQARLHQMERRMAEAPSRSIAVVQGSIEQKVKWDPDQRVFTLQTYRDLSTRAAAQNPWLVVWPETAMPFYYVRDEGTTQWLDQWVRQTGRPVLFGAPAFEYHGLDKRHYNRAYLLGPGAERLGYYDKVHLVPYGEYVPLQKFMPFIKKLTQASGTFFPGEEGKVLRLDGQGLGVLICYESIFPVLARKAVNQGAQYLVVITNDAWFGRSSAPRQHYDHAVLRAVEHRRSVIRAANTGISGLIRPDGRTVTDLGLFERDFIIGSLPGLSGRTLYTAAGDVIPWASLGATLVLFAATLIRRRHAGRS